jgi:ABC-2 type transport system ATP-binding protein
MLKLQSVSYTYPKAAVATINNLDLEVNAGGIYGLLGANGEGKSTLLYLMTGLLRPQFGTVTFNGQDVALRNPAMLADVFIVPEEFTLPSVKLSSYVKNMSPFYPKFSQTDMTRYLEHFRIEGDVHLGRLSMGQKKKVFIAFALACNTSLLIMDEPTNGLDIPGKSEFRRTMVSAMTDERTMIISTHQVRDLDRILDHVIILNNSKLLLNRSTAEITEQLLFRTTPIGSGSTEGALYVETSAGMQSVILPNSANEESDVNLETLFNFAYNDADALQTIFK